MSGLLGAAELASDCAVCMLCDREVLYLLILLYYFFICSLSLLRATRQLDMKHGCKFYPSGGGPTGIDFRATSSVRMVHS